MHITLVGALMLTVPYMASAQSLLDRPPNISGDWTGAPGTLYFHFIHRFSTSSAPERKVSNVPTFLLAAGLPMRFLAGVNYSTNSSLAPRFPNEWEVFARWAPLSEDIGSPIDVGGQIGYNNAAEGVDGEVSVARRFGPARLIAVGRALSNPVESGKVRYAFGGGGTIRLGTYVALAGDVSSLTSRDSSEHVAWSAGIHLAIPLSPHTFSLQVTNTLVSTLQGVSRGTDGRRYGFEFTIPLTLRRYFGSRARQSPGDSAATARAADSVPAVAPVTADSVASVNPPSAPAPTTSAPVTLTPTAPAMPSRSPPAPAAARTVRNGMRNLNYLQSRLTVTVGTTVVWKNNDPLPHTVTAVDRSFNSGLIQPGKTYSHTFTTPGTYNFFCQPHPFMKGVIVVKE